jgi:hypothetical protein
MIVDTQYAFVNILVVVFPLLLPFRLIRLFLLLFWFAIVWHNYLLVDLLAAPPCAIRIPLLKLGEYLLGVAPPFLA